MGFYAKHILPRLIEAAMSKEDTAKLRAQSVPQARGDVLEVGIGSGLNLPYYSSEVRRVYGVDPSMELQRLARKRMGDCRASVEFLAQGADHRLPLEDQSIDTVVCTWTLCTIPDAAAALREMRRVLRADGRYLFVEHGRSPDAGVVKWQDRLTPMMKKIGGGCHLNRKVDSMIEAAGFRIKELKTFYNPGGPRPMTFTYQGEAERGR